MSESGLQPGATGKPPVYATGGRRKRQYPQARRLSQSDLANPQPGAGKLGTAAYRHPETLFEQGAENLGELVSGLNGVRMHDQQGEPWSESSFRAFLQVNGY